MDGNVKTFDGVGTILANGKEFRASYKLNIRDGVRGRECDGILNDVHPSDQFDLITAQTEIFLRINSGRKLKIAFFGSANKEPCRIKVAAVIAS